VALVEKPLRLDLPDEKLLADYAEGMSIAKVAAKYRCSTQAVKTRLVKAGVEIRPRGSYSKGRKKKKPVVDHEEIAAKIIAEREAAEAPKVKPKVRKIGW